MTHTPDHIVTSDHSPGDPEQRQAPLVITYQRTRTSEALRLPDGRIRIRIDPYTGGTTGPDVGYLLRPSPATNYIVANYLDGALSLMDTVSLALAHELAQASPAPVWVLEIQDP